MSALRWAEVAAAAAGDGMLVTVRRGKTNPEGEARDVRFVKGAVARALQTLRSASSPAPEDRVVPLSPQMVGLRFQAAARAGDRSLGKGGAGVGADDPGRVDDRRWGGRGQDTLVDEGAGSVGRWEARARLTVRRPFLVGSG